MEFTDLKAIPISMNLRPLEDDGIAPYVGSKTTVDQVERMLVRLDTADGITGWGEIRPELGVSTTKTFLEESLATKVVGRRVWEIQPFASDSLYTEYTNVNSLVAGVEIAMWDALGKYLDAPLHQLLGGKCTNQVEFADVLGIIDPDESNKYARRTLENGFNILKLKAGPPNSNWENDVERVKSMYEATDGQLSFRLDPNQSWSFDEVVRAGAELEDSGIHLQYLEQPIRINTPGTYRLLRSRLKQPIAVNEDTYHPGNLLQLIRGDAIDAAVVDLVPSGGILGLKRLAAIAGEAGLSVAHHCGFDLGVKTAAILHAVSSTPAINLPADLAYHHWEDDVITDRFEIKEGCIAVPDDPGLGITVDLGKIERYRLD